MKIKIKTRVITTLGKYNFEIVFSRFGYANPTNVLMVSSTLNVDLFFKLFF